MSEAAAAATPIPTDLVRLSEAAKLVSESGVHPATVYRWVQRGKLRAWRVGHNLHVSRADLFATIRPVQAEGYREPEPSAEQQRESERRAWDYLKRMGVA